MNSEAIDQQLGTVRVDENDCKVNSCANRDESDSTCSPAKQQRFQVNQSHRSYTEKNSASSYSASANQNMQQDEEPEDSEERKAAIRARLAKMGARSMIPSAMPALSHSKQPHQTRDNDEVAEKGVENEKPSSDHVRNISGAPMMSMMAELERKISVKKKVGPPVAVKKRNSDIENHPTYEAGQERLQDDEVGSKSGSEVSIDTFWQNPAEESKVENVIISSSLESVQRKEEMLDVRLARNRANLASQRRAKPSAKLRGTSKDIDVDDGSNKSVMSEPVEDSVEIKAIFSDNANESNSLNLPSVTQAQQTTLSCEAVSSPSYPLLDLSLPTTGMEDKVATQNAPSKLLPAPVDVFLISAAPKEETLLAKAEVTVADPVTAELPVLALGLVDEKSVPVKVPSTEAPPLLVTHHVVEKLPVSDPVIKSLKYEESTQGTVNTDEVKWALIPASQGDESMMNFKSDVWVELHSSDDKISHLETGGEFVSSVEDQSLVSFESAEINAQSTLLDLDIPRASHLNQPFELLSSCEEDSGIVKSLLLENENDELQSSQRCRNDFTPKGNSEQINDAVEEEFEIIDKDMIESEILLANSNVKLPDVETLFSSNNLETTTQRQEEVLPIMLDSTELLGSRKENNLCIDSSPVAADNPICLPSKASTVNTPNQQKQEASFYDLDVEPESAEDRKTNTQQVQILPDTELTTKHMSLSEGKELVTLAYSQEKHKNTEVFLFENISCNVDALPHQHNEGLSSSYVSTLSKNGEISHKGGLEDNTQLEETSRFKVLPNDPGQVDVIQTPYVTAEIDLLGDTKLPATAEIAPVKRIEAGELPTDYKLARVDWNEGTKLANDSEKVRVNILHSKLPPVSDTLRLQLEDSELPTDSPPALPTSEIPDDHFKPCNYKEIDTTSMYELKPSLSVPNKADDSMKKVLSVSCTRAPLKVTVCNKDPIFGHKLENDVNQAVKPDSSLDKKNKANGLKSSNTEGVSTAVKVFNSMQPKGWIPPKTPPPQSKVPELTHFAPAPDSWRSRLKKVDSKVLVPTATACDSPAKEDKKKDSIRSLPTMPLRVKIPQVKTASDISGGELKSPSFMQEWERVRQQRQSKSPALKNTSNRTQLSLSSKTYEPDPQVPEFMKLAAKFHAKHGVLADAEAR